MSDLLGSLITPEVRAAITVIIAFIVLLYLLSIIWTIRDAYLRGANPVIWGIVAVIPFVGCMAYAMLRPPLYASDREEQNIGLLLQQRELMSYGECPQCGYPTERDYVVCPNCHVRLRNVCGNCGHTLEPEWRVCPYCATPAGKAAPQKAQMAAPVHRAQNAPRPQMAAPQQAHGADHRAARPAAPQREILTQTTPPARTTTARPAPSAAPRTGAPQGAPRNDPGAAPRV